MLAIDSHLRIELKFCKLYKQNSYLAYKIE